MIWFDEFFENTSLLVKIRDEDKEEVVRDTCKLAVERLLWLEKEKTKEENELSTNPYASTDPAPPALEAKNVKNLKETLLSEDLELFPRYRAMFSLRNLGTDESILALAEDLKSPSTFYPD